jgi:flagellar protein FliJ
MKYKFRLEKLLNYRQIQLKTIQKELALSYQGLWLEEKNLDSLYETKNQSFIFSKTVSMGSWSDEFRYLQDIRIERQKELVKQAYTQVEKVRNLLIEKDRELKMLEKIKEKKQEEFFYEMEKKDQNEQDDRSSFLTLSKGKNGFKEK